MHLSEKNCDLKCLQELNFYTDMKQRGWTKIVTNDSVYFGTAKEEQIPTGSHLT